MLDKVLKMGELFDFYGSLLTDKQRCCMEMYYIQDLSLAEIGAELDISRQAVHDMLRRSEQMLTEFEEKLQLATRYDKERRLLTEVYALLGDLPPDMLKQPMIVSAREKIKTVLEYSGG